MMKRLWIAVLLAALLISGCGRIKPEGPSLQNSSQVEEEVSQENTESVGTEDQTGEEAAAPSILDHKQLIEGQTGIYYVPCAPVESMKRCTPYLLGNSLLTYKMTYDDQGNNPTLYLAAVDLKTGELVGEKTYQTPNYISMQILGEYLCMADAATGWVGIFDEQLTAVTEYNLTPDEGSWYFSPDMQKVYSIGWDSGIRCIDLTEAAAGAESAAGAETVQWTPLLGNVTQMIPTKVDKERILAAYTDVATQMHECQLFSLATGTLEELPLTGQFYQVNQAEAVWFYHHPVDWQSYIVQSGGQTRQVTVEQGYMMLLDGGHLMVANDDATEMKVYDGNGGYLAGFSLPDGGHADGSWVWSEKHGGYFTVMFNYNTGDCQLLFLDMTQQQVGAPLALQSYGSGQSGNSQGGETGSFVSAELYERARQLSEQYDVDIRIAENCGLEYADFTADMLTEEWSINYALDSLETALASYPAGFFTQLKCGNLTSIRIEIVHNLRDKRTQEGDAFTEFNGFVREEADHRLMVLDAETMYVDTIYHEFSHMIDARLAFDANLRSDALYSETTWLEMQPGDYEFPYSYAEIPEYVYEANRNGYFVSVYGGTYPTEDRATVMESAMSGYYGIFTAQPVLMEKLYYYSECIRDCFDTTGWPEVTKWEEPLYN